MPSRSPWEWQKQDVKEWVDSLFGEQLAIAFEDNDVTGHLLLTEVNEEVLRESIIVESWGLRKRILNAINDLLQRHPTDNTPISASASISPTRTSVAIARNKPLTIDEIWKALDQHINNVVIPKWENEKKPLLEQSAYQIWMKRRSDPRFIEDSESTLNHILHHRIPRICEALAQSGATKIGDLLRVSASLEVACCDARKLMWQINLLQGTKPAPPDPSLIPLNTKAKLAHKADESGSDESLSSDQGWSSVMPDDETEMVHSDSDWSDFIVADDAIGDERVASEDHSDEDHHFYSSSQEIEEESNGSQSSSSSLVRQQKRPRDSSESDESETSTKQRISKSSTVSGKHTTFNRSKRHRSRKIKHVHDEEGSAMSTQDSETDTTAIPQTNSRRKHVKQSDHGRSRKYSEADTSEHESDASLILLSESSRSESDNEKSESENEKSGFDELKNHRKQRAVSDASSVDDQSIRHLLETYLSEQTLPHVTNIFSKMSNASILDLFLSLNITSSDDLSTDEQELLKELKPIFFQLSGEKDIPEMVTEGEQQLDIINGLQVVRDILSERAHKKTSTRRRKVVRRRQNKRVSLSDDESDTSDEEKDSKEVNSLTTDALLVSKKGFRKIWDESKTVASMRKHHQEMWKEIEARAETELNEKQESDTEVTMNVGDVETAKRVTIDPHLARHLKKHQIDGIRFLWRQTMMLETGGVLGHAMGLGKTLQVITYLHTIFREIANDNPDLPEKVKPGRFLILAPVTTLKNWENEFKAWIPRSDQSLMRQVINYSSAKASGGFSRETLLRTWFKRGGVLLMGYEMFRQAVKNMDSSSHPIRKWLIDPGPSVVIIDEGHKIKSNKSQLSSVVKLFDTKFRICMTGYPLQNNLDEYYCMIDFIYPGYLGTLPEFRNAYKNPIEYFYEDISPAERFISRRQLYKLQRTLADLIHRRDTAILQSELKPKTEFDIFCKLTTEQYDAYKLCLDDARVGKNLSPIQAFQVLRNLCNHPAALLEQLQNGQGRTSDYFNQTTKKIGSNLMTETPNVGSSASSSPDTPNASPVLPGLNAVSGSEKMFDEEEVTIPNEVASAFQATREYLQNISDLKSIEHSCKSTVMMELVKESLKVDDKLIIFSHSIPSLNYIGRVMKKENIDTLRIDGSTPVILRQDIIDKFNKTNRWPVILVSAKAASIGINLVSANRVIIYDLDWNPCHNEQAVARAYRFGQKKDVFVYRLQTYDTIEQTIFGINVHKAGISSRVVDDKTLKPQKLVVMKAFYKLPAPSPIEPLKESAYTAIEDPVLKVVAEACKDKLADLQLHTSYTTEYLHEELNEKQKEEIEQQLTLENRIRNGEVVEGMAATQEIITIADTSPEIGVAAPSPLPPQLHTSIPAYHRHPSHNSSLGVSFSSIRSIPQPNYSTQHSSSASLSGTNSQYRQAIFAPSATASTEWKQPLPHTVNRFMNSSEQPYQESHHSQSTSDLPRNKENTADTSSHIPNTFRGPNITAYPNSPLYYREDTSMDTAEHFRQQVEKFKLQMKDYGNKFPGGTSSGNLPNNASLQ